MKVDKGRTQMKKMIIFASVLLVLGLGAGFLGFMAFTQASRDEGYASGWRTLAAKQMATPLLELDPLEVATGRRFSVGPTPQDQARESYAEAAEFAADAEGQRTLGWVFVGGAVVVVGAAGVLFTLALRKRASGTRTDPNATVVVHHV